MATYECLQYLLMTTDPVHVGTGGYRLGRVDNTIVREPGTRVPKIPGTSLHGAARSYAARLYEDLAAAGQSQKGVPDPHRHPVCYTFGFLKEEAGETETDKKTTAYSGVISVFDAHVVLFPVHSMAGPVWVSTTERLKDAGFQVTAEERHRDMGEGLFTWGRTDPLNLGWLMLAVGGKTAVTAPEQWRVARWDVMKDRIVVVQESLFSQVVNSNLEVRTSVSIDPKRGAAEDKALFTYEALPRATFLVMEAVLDDYRESENKRPFPASETAEGNQLPGKPWGGPRDVFEAGLRMMEWLGVGGMGTRGFGRLAVIGEPSTRVYGKEAQR